MKKILNQFLVLPIFALFCLSELCVVEKTQLKINIIEYIICIALALLIKFLKRYGEKSSKKTGRIIDIACLVIGLSYFCILFRPLLISLVNYVVILIKQKTIVFNFDFLSIREQAFYYGTFVLIRLMFNFVFVEKHTALLSLASLCAVQLGYVIDGHIRIIDVAIVALCLFFIIFRSSFDEVKNAKFYKSILISLVFIGTIILGYFLAPYIGSINVKETINGGTGVAGEAIASAIDGQGLDAGEGSGSSIPGMGMSPGGDGEIEDEIFITINSSYEIDRLKAYACGKYDINTNTFIIDEEINDQIGDTTKLFLRKDNTELPEYMIVTVMDPSDQIAYVPYGDLKMDNNDAFLYKDSIVQFVNDKEYSEYSLSFNPYGYNDALLDENVTNNSYSFSDYHNYAFAHYSYANDMMKIEMDSLPESIGHAAESFMGKQYSLDPSEYEYIYRDNIYESERENINLANYLLKKYITIKPTYERNDEGIDDITYCLTTSHEANPQLMAAVSTMVYRSLGIPARYVVGYKVKGFEGNVAYISKRDLTYWSEVFIEGQWVPSDDLYMPIGEGGSTGSGSASGDAEEDQLLKPSGEISKESFDMANGDGENESGPALTIETNYEVDRIKQTSYGDYDTEKMAFGYEEDISNFNSIKRADVLYDMDSYFKDMFILKDRFKYNMKITYNTLSTNVYVPYGKVNLSNISMYQDKSYTFNNKTQSYLLTFEPYGQKKFKPNSFYTDFVYDKYLSVPEEFKETLQKYLLDNGIDYTSNDKNLLIRQIKDLLQGGKYKYNLEIDEIPENKDVLLYFLLESKEGYCQHFAGSATLLYRICGIPARYTTGYAVRNYKDGVAEITSKDAHAWTEVYTSNLGWTPIEVTASSNDGLPQGGASEETQPVDNNSQGLNEEAPLESINEFSFNEQPENTPKPKSKQNKEELEVDEDTVVLTIETNKELYRVKAYSLGNYNEQEHCFDMEEDISNLEKIKRISELYDINTYFVSLFTRDNELENRFSLSNYGADNWLYVPYGLVNTEEVSMYQDKYLYFENEEKYLDYSLTYKEFDPNQEFDPSYDYEDFVYSYYNDVPYDFKNKLYDFLNTHGIDYKDEDKEKLLIQVRDLLLNNYQLDNHLYEPSGKEDPVLSFIIKDKKGTYEEFAKAATILYRICGIPARYVSGYYLNDYVDNKFEVKNSDEHAWTEVYTSNLGWAPVETCPEHNSEDINVYKFERHIREENKIEFIDTEKKEKENNIIQILAIVVVTIMACIIVFAIVKKRKEYKNRIKAMGMDSEQLKLLKEINKNYLLLKTNGYTTPEIELIMLRIRFSKKVETKEDLEIILKQVEFMKTDKKNNPKKRQKAKKNKGDCK